MARHYARKIMLSIACIATGCSDGATAPDANLTSDGDPKGGPLLGAFTVTLVAPHADGNGGVTEGVTTFFGKVYDGPTPQGTLWTQVETSNGCTLVTPSVPFCATPCGSTAVCTAANTCTPYPKSQAVGTIKVTGVKSNVGTAFEMSPVVNGYQPAADVNLQYPAFGDGDTLTLSAGGSSFAGAFATQTTGIATLSISNSPLELKAGQPLTVQWPAGQNSNTRIDVKLDISHHGGTKGKIECEVADTGALTIAASMIDKLVALGTAGFPSIELTRRTKGYAPVATGHIEFIAASMAEVPVTVPGVISCTGNENCPQGQTCQSDLTCK